jgi:hypothetical protein
MSTATDLQIKFEDPNDWRQRLEEFVESAKDISMKAGTDQNPKLSHTANLNEGFNDAPELKTAGPNNEIQYTVGQPQVNPELLAKCQNSSMLADTSLKLPEPNAASPAAELFGAACSGLEEITAKVNQDFLQGRTQPSPDFTPQTPQYNQTFTM